MALKDPTAWMNDLTFYMSEESVSGNAGALEPQLLQPGSKTAAAAWIALSGILGGAFGAVTISPDIRHPLTFAIYVAISALLLRGLHPLTVRLLSRGVAWLAMFAFFWTALLGLCVVLGARIESRWIGYGLSIGGGAFIGMMYGAFPPATFGTRMPRWWRFCLHHLAPLSRPTSSVNPALSIRSAAQRARAQSPAEF